MNDTEMIPCDHVIAKLWEYVDGQLEEPASDAVEAHLDVCARCFPEYDFRRAYKRFVSQAGATQVPADVRRRVFAAILEEEHRGGADSETSTTDSRGRLGRWVDRWIRRR